MAFSRFNLQVLLRLIGIALTMFGGTYSYFKTDFIISPIGFGVVSLVQLIALYWYINRTRQDLLKFFKSFDSRDFAKNYHEQYWDGTSDELKQAFNSVLSTFRQLTLEREEQYQYLQMVNEHVSTGILSFSSDGKIDLLNSAAQDLLGLPILQQFHQIQNHDQALYDQLAELKVGDQQLLTLKKNNRKVTARCREFQLLEKSYKLISFQDISAELEEQELDAWQKLIRVLTHEIMNSVTPVVSLTTAMKTMLQDDNGELRSTEIEEEGLTDIFKSLTAIEKRGKGLMDFVKAYRDYTKPPVPEIQKVNVFSLINDALQLSKPYLSKVRVALSTVIPEEDFIMVDDKLISQVLINLLKNAAEALEGKEEGVISIDYLITDTQQIISVKDNGPGIPKEELEEIFVPFYNTKKQGSGIGLSLTKQIMKAHGANITVESIPSRQTMFSLEFLKATR